MEGWGSIPSLGTKILQATWCRQKKKYITKVTPILQMQQLRCRELTFPRPYNFEVEPAFKSVSKSYKSKSYCAMNSHVLSTGGWGWGGSGGMLEAMIHQFSSVQLLSRVWLFVTPWIAACQASLSITNSRSSLILMSIESVMPSSHLILCHPLLLLPPIPPSIRVFSNESTLRMRWPKYWSFSFSISPSID